MNLNRITYLLRIVGAGIFLFGVYEKMLPLWIVGLVVMLSGNVIRLVMKKKEAQENQQQ